MEDKLPYFIVYQEEYDKANVWLEEHNKTCKLMDNDVMPGYPYCGAVGGRLTWSFTPTGIGTFTTIKCACGEKCDVTDTSSW